MRYLRTNTATRITVGPFFDKTDGVTPETSLTVTSCKLTLMVDDAGVPTLVLDTAPTASGGSNDMVHVTGDDAGFYDLELAAANVNYLGRAMLAITDAATHCPVFHEFMILPAMIYDSLILGSDRLDTNVTHVGDTAQTAGDIFARLGAPAGASMSADVAAIKSDTAAILVDTGTTLDSRIPAALVGGRMDVSVGAMAADVMTAAAAAADLTAELQSGLATASALATAQTSIDDLPTNAELATALGTADDAVLAQVALVKAKTDNLPSDPADASDIAAAFSTVNGTLTTIATYIDTEVAAIKAKTDNLPAAPAATGDIPSAATIADSVLDELLSGHAIAGSAGAALSAASASGDPWATVVPGAYSAGTAGYRFGNFAAAGAGATTWTYTVTDSSSGAPIADVSVWVSSDSGGSTVLASGLTNASGVVTFYLDAGTVYVWRQKAGYNFTNPDTEVVS